MNQLNSRLYKVLLVVIIAIIIIIVSIFFYNLSQIEKNRNLVFDETKKLVVKETDLENINNMHVFQEKKLYHIFIGNNKNKEELISFINIKEDDELSAKDIKTYNTVDFVSENAMLNDWEQNCNQCELINIQPAIIDEQLLWEITYNDVDNRYVFDYYSMTNGKQYEELKLRRNFN